MFNLSSTNEECSLNPLDSARFIMERAKNVRIDQHALEKLSTMISNAMMNGELTLDDWIGTDLGPPKDNPQLAIDWIFLTSTLNFSFWTTNDQSKDCSFSREYKNQIFYGYEALCASINQAIDDGIDILNAQYYSQITMKQLEDIFKPSKDSSPLPMLNERLNVLHQTGSILLQKYGGHFDRCIEESDGSALHLLQLIVQQFPSYRDEAIYQGQRVSFYKRAQILISDIWGCFHGHHIGHFKDMDCLTMFADYRVPQVLSHEGVLVYSKELKYRIEEKEEIPFGDSDECEIRAGSILSVHLISHQASEKSPLEVDTGDDGQRLNAPIVDVYLWRRRRQLAQIYQLTPFHRTRSIFY